METPADILNTRLGNIRDNGDTYFDHAAIAIDIDSELQEKFLFIPREELEQLLRDELEENRDRISLGSGPEHCAAGVGENPTWVYNHAMNALALWWKLKQDAEKEQEKLAKRPEPGVYQGRRSGWAGYFTVIVDAERRVLVQQPSTGGLLDQSGMYDECVTTDKPWKLQRVDITDGTISA